MTKAELENIRDKKCESFLEAKCGQYSTSEDDFKAGFDAATSLLLVEIESLQAKLKVACDALERIRSSNTNSPKMTSHEALAELRKKEGKK